MPIITNQATLRTSVADWLNRTDLSNNQLDQFIEMGEAKIYEILRVPPLEKLQAYSVTTTDSSITLPSGFTELISLKKEGAGTCSIDPTTNTTRALCLAVTPTAGTWTDSDKDNDIILSRVDEKAFANQKIKHAYVRVANNVLITNADGEQLASGEFLLNFYKADEPIGTLALTTTTVLVVGNSYTIQSVGTSTQTDWEAAGVPVGTTAVVGLSFTATSTSIAGGDTVKLETTTQFILDTEYEVALFATLSVAYLFLGDNESEAKYSELCLRKINALNAKEIKASLKGGSFSAVYSARGI
jgi:hypothetical protein